MSDHWGAPFALTAPIDHVEWLDSVESTNRYLIDQLPSPGTHLVATWNQTSGSGRLGRHWVSPAGKSLAISLELGPRLTPTTISEQWLGALALLSGATLADAVTTTVAPASVKWPNDVLIDGHKVAGILGQVAGPRRVIIGMGINVWLGHEQLPTPQATSLGLHGLDDPESLGVIVNQWLENLVSRLRRCLSGVTQREWDFIAHHLSTIGQEVRVVFPDGRQLLGVAVGLDTSGGLIVRDVEGNNHSLAAGDIEHLRPLGHPSTPDPDDLSN